jgi:phosphonate transport system substrate-binding protein
MAGRMNRGAGPGRAGRPGFTVWLAAGAVFLLAPGASGPAAPALPAAVRIAYLPIFGKQATLERFKPLTEHLGKTLNLPVTAESFDDYDDVVVALAKGEFEAAYLSPDTYVLASEVAKLTPVAMELDRRGNPGYHALLICRSDKKYQTVDDARGGVLALVNSTSTSGFLLPLNYFLQVRKETPESFAGKVVFAGDHEKVIKGVLGGTYDLGATNDMDLERTMQAAAMPAGTFRVLWTSDLIPGSPVCVRSDLSPEFQAAFLAALLKFNEDAKGLAALEIGGYAKATDHDYALVRQMERMTR